MTNKINKNLLFKILKMEQYELKRWLYKKLKYYGYTPVSGDGFIFAQGKLNMCMVAHMDTVLQQPKYINYVDGIMSCPTGLGADDRAGIYGILHLLQQGHRPTILFTEDEEIGCVGSDKFIQAKIQIENLHYFIQLDRRGKMDSVYYSCANKDFQEYIDGFGFKKAQGSFTDIVGLMSAYNKAGVNLSVGYVNEHTTAETLTVSHLARTLKLTSNILKDNASEVFDYQEEEFDASKYYSSFKSYSSYTGMEDDIDYTDNRLIDLTTGMLINPIDDNDYVDLDFADDMYYMSSDNIIYDSDYNDTEYEYFSYTYEQIFYNDLLEDFKYDYMEMM